MRLPVAVLAVLAAVVVGLVILGLVVWASEPRLPTGPAVAPPAPGARVASVDYSVGSRTAQIDEARLMLPGPPYGCDSRPAAGPPAFTSLITCSALVHEDYNAKGDDWYATMGFGVLEPSLVVPGDPSATADQLFSRLRSSLFADQQTTVKAQQRQPIDLGGTERAQSVRGNVTYRVPGLPSTYDRLLVVVIPLDRGDTAVAYSDRPDDLAAGGLDALNASLGTLTARK